MKPVTETSGWFTHGVYLILGSDAQELKVVFHDLTASRSSVQFEAFVGERKSFTDIHNWFEQVGAGPFVISTMHPWVIDHLPLESAEDARQRLLFIRDGKLCILEDDELNLLWRDYKMGFQQISEIIRVHGLLS